MKEVVEQIRYDVYHSVDELQPEDRRLLDEALKAAFTAYAPYSGFKVGAAVLLSNGIIVPGSNQENAAYPSGLCAERVAIYSASAGHPGVRIVAIAVIALHESGSHSPVSPCGDCRQVMAETEHRYSSPLKVIMAGADGTILITKNIGTLLPLMFSAENLPSL
jgi:cytidine deaminase